jgi:hypothetical protein
MGGFMRGKTAFDPSIHPYRKVKKPAIPEERDASAQRL